MELIFREGICATSSNSENIFKIIKYSYLTLYSIIIISSPIIQQGVKGILFVRSFTIT